MPCVWKDVQLESGRREGILSVLHVERAEADDQEIDRGCEEEEMR